MIDRLYSSSTDVFVESCPNCGQFILDSSVVHVCKSSLFSYPKTRSVLHVSPNLRIEHEAPKPNRWYRFWYRVLLGWKWTDE